MDKLEFPKKRRHLLFAIIGGVISVLTFTMIMQFSYSYFFCRNNYLNRKRFKKWLNKNDIGMPYFYFNDDVILWKIDGHSIYWDRKVYGRIYIGNVLCEFAPSFVDKVHNKEIMDRLEESYNKYYPKCGLLKGGDKL